MVNEIRRKKTTGLAQQWREKSALVTLRITGQEAAATTRTAGTDVDHQSHIPGKPSLALCKFLGDLEVALCIGLLRIPKFRGTSTLLRQHDNGKASEFAGELDLPMLERSSTASTNDVGPSVPRTPRHSGCLSKKSRTHKAVGAYVRSAVKLRGWLEPT